MKAITLNEIRTVEGGGTVHCHYCGKTFKDKKIKFLCFTLYVKSGDQEYAQHLRNFGSSCMYR